MANEGDNGKSRSATDRDKKRGSTKRESGQSRGDDSPEEKKERGGKKEKKLQVSKKTLIIGGVILGILVLAGTLYWLHARNFESTDDAYTTAHVHDISARVAGTVEKVNVDDNQFVHTGQSLVLLDRRDFQVSADQAKAQMMQRKAAADQAQANLDHAQQDYDRFTKLGRDQVVSKQEVDNATAGLKNANGAMTAARADLAASEAALSTAELQLSYTAIVAPADGVVAKKTVETGARLQPGQALMAVVEKDVWVLGNFKETQLAKMRVGQHVDVKIDALPGQKFSAHVDSLQPGTGSTFSLLPADNATGNFTKIVQRVPVKIVFDDLGQFRDRVAPGLSCRPKVDLRTGPKN